MQIKKYFAVIMIALLTFMTMATGQVAHAQAENPETGSLTIHKYEMEPGAEYGADGDGSAGQELPDGAEPLEGVQYTIIQTHSYNAATDEWTEVSGATPIIKVTGDDGTVIFGDLELGRYTVDETGGPSHVNLNPDTYSVDIPMTSADGTDINYNVHIYPKNEIIRGAVKLKKIDGENGFVGLPGAVFNLYKAGDGLVEENIEVNSSGYIYVDGLAYGDYYFTEIAAPEGYVLQSGKFTFSISESGTINKDGGSTGKVERVKVKNYFEPEIEKTINGEDADLPINRETVFEYNLKIKLPSDIQNYQRFVVTDELDSRLTYGGTWTVDGVAASALTFDDTGQTLTWTVNDAGFAALEGVKEITINFTATVNEDAEAGEGISNIGEIDYTNESGTDGDGESEEIIVTPTAGSLTVNKVDENGDALQGAEFELRNAKGDIVGTEVGGTITWTELDYGEYTLHETIAPDGYRKLLKPINVTIEKSNVTVEVKNTKSGWELPKTGGIGTTLFSGIGILLMAAAIMIFARRRGSATLL